MNLRQNSRLPNESTLQYVAGDTTPPRHRDGVTTRLRTSRRPAEQRLAWPTGESPPTMADAAVGHCHPAPLWWQASDRNRGTKDQLLPTGEVRPHLGSVLTSSRWFHTMCGRVEFTDDHRLPVGAATVTYMLIEDQLPPRGRVCSASCAQG